MEKIIVFLFGFLTFFSFSSEISIKSGFSLDFNKNVLEIYDSNGNKIEFSDKNDNTNKFKEYNVPIYLNLSADYTDNIYNINKNMILKMTGGIDLKVGYVSLIQTVFDAVPVHVGAYVNPKLEYRFENDVKLNTGVKLGVGFVADKYILQKEKLEFEVKVDTDTFYTAVFPLETVIGLQYKKFVTNIEIGGKIYVPNKRDILTSKFVLKQKNDLKTFDKESKVKFVPSIGVNMGYLFEIK